MNFHDMDLLRSVISTLGISGRVVPFEKIEHEKSEGGMNLDQLGNQF